MLSPGFCRDACSSISTMFTRIAAGPTIWATKIADPARALALLDEWEQELRAVLCGPASHPVFIALRPRSARSIFPSSRSAICSTAFRQDQVVRRYETWDDR